MSLRLAVVVCWLFGSLPGAAAAQEKPPASPLSPEQALAEFRLPADLTIELAACEPQVLDPVAIRFDERGRMWVVEMGDYPHGPGEGESPKSQIRILEDRDGDGRFEQATVFAEGLLFTTGVQPWRDGAFVTMAGQIAFFKDGDGDGKAEMSETWYAGFTQENSQLRANHPRLSWDGHIYVANGLRGGAVFDPSRPGTPALSISGMDFRFHPLSREFEAVTGNGQFGMAFDDWGDRYTCSNRNPLRQVVIEDRYLKRSPLALIPEAVHDVAEFGELSRLYPLTRAWTTSNLHAGQFTAACGVNFYRGDLLPEAYYGDAFTCDPTGNLLHREKLAPAGAVNRSQSPTEGVEFLASRDEWFRPVNSETGPDGALYVVDMYRAVIEHPDFMPDELKKRPDLHLGHDRGRIWRIVPAGRTRPAPQRLDGLSSEQLVGELAAKNAWRRETAARLLLAQPDPSAQAALEAAAQKCESAPGRATALWTLSHWNALSANTLAAALEDESPLVRRQAVRLAEQMLAGDASWRERIVARLDDGDARVRFQAALSISPAQGPELEAVARAALAGAADPWMRRAATIAAGPRAGELVRLLATSPLPQDAQQLAGLSSLWTDLASQAGRSGLAEQRQACLEAIASLAQAPVAARLAALEACLLASARSGAAPEAVLASLAPERKAEIDALFSQASAIADDAAAEPASRIAAVALLALSPTHGQQIARLALEEPEQNVRRQAIAMLARQADPAPWVELFSRFRSESPGVRGEILDGALARTDRTALLLDAIAAGQIKPGEIDVSRADRLLKHGDAQLRVRAAEIFRSQVAADRQKVLADYQACLSLPADFARGRQVFAKNCANCHRIGELGVNVAPDISDSRVKTAEQILTDVLQPNRAIDNNYISYTVITSDGRTHNGVLSLETATSITLRQPEGKSITLPRSEIEQIRSDGVSLMPEGLEKEIPPQAMADLIGFIKNWRYLDGLTPLGQNGEGN